MTVSDIKGVSKCGKKMDTVEHILFGRAAIDLIYHDLIDNPEQTYPKPGLKPW
jgi:hypothetical protein